MAHIYCAPPCPPGSYPCSVPHMCALVFCSRAHTHTRVCTMVCVGPAATRRLEGERTATAWIMRTAGQRVVALDEGAPTSIIERDFNLYAVRAARALAAGELEQAAPEWQSYDEEYRLASPQARDPMPQFGSMVESRNKPVLRLLGHMANRRIVAIIDWVSRRSMRETGATHISRIICLNCRVAQEAMSR